jgi:hypothetical protein
VAVGATTDDNKLVSAQHEQAGQKEAKENFDKLHAITKHSSSRRSFQY